MSAEPAIETFPEYPPFGTPSLRSWTYRKTMTIKWDVEGSIRRYQEFTEALDCTAMNAELLAIWERYKAQCDRRAIFFGGNCIGGCMYCVPIAAGVEVVATIRKYFIRALEGRSHE